MYLKIGLGLFGHCERPVRIGPDTLSSGWPGCLGDEHRRERVALGGVPARRWLTGSPSAQIAGPQLPPVQIMVALNGVAWL